MGLCGLGLAWRAAAQVLGAPAAVGEGLAALSAVVFCFVAACYLAAQLRSPGMAVREFRDPATCVYFFRQLPRCSRARVAVITGLLGPVVLSGSAFAQSTIGAQLGTMAQEASTAGGTLASTAMYVAALICFIGGVWSLWQSRQPQNREGGRVAMGLAGLVLCGLFCHRRGLDQQGGADHHWFGRLDHQHRRRRKLPVDRLHASPAPPPLGTSFGLDG